MLALGCHQASTDPSPISSTTTIDKVWPVEASGSAVADTSVTFANSTGRTVVMHHAEPDGAIFVVFHFPPSADTLRRRDSMHITIRPTPGRYGFVLQTTDKLATGTVATFSYALHFRTPAEAAAKYPSPGRFEQMVIPAFVSGDNRVQFLAATRPAADMLRFPVTTSGSYALMVPR